MEEFYRSVKNASYVLAGTEADVKNKALKRAAHHLHKATTDILEANEKDLLLLPDGTPSSLRDRLLLTPERICSMIEGIETIIKLPDPVGIVLEETLRPNGLKIRKVSVPLGVIGMIYESRPNVTADAAALCLKSGNACILRGGSESFNSSQAIAQAFSRALHETKLPDSVVRMIPTADRSAVDEMLKMDGYIDVIIPRGGKSLIEKISRESRIPTLKHYDGICHTYIHEKADLDIAMKILINGKLRRTGVCNATETLLIDRSIVTTHLLPLLSELEKQGCRIKGDGEVLKIHPKATKVDTYHMEYLDKILAVKIVSNVTEAVAHIHAYGSAHTESIVTGDEKAARAFLQSVGSAVVMHNASTAFCDGGEFGMGAEIGISTGKLHARGPVGLRELTTYKYEVLGTGQTRKP